MVYIYIYIDSIRNIKLSLATSHPTTRTLQTVAQVCRNTACSIKVQGKVLLLVSSEETASGKSLRCKSWRSAVQAQIFPGQCPSDPVQKRKGMERLPSGTPSSRCRVENRVTCRTSQACGTAEGAKPWRDCSIVATRIGNSNGLQPTSNGLQITSWCKMVGF